MTTSDGLQGRPTARPLPIWPLVLIAAGGFLLAANLGLVSWSALWNLWYLWPIVLVAVGADILLGGRYRLFVVLGALVVGAAIYASTSGGLGAVMDPSPEAIAQGLDGASRAEVRISTGVTRLTVASDPSSDLLVAGSVTPLRGERIERSFEVASGVARFSLDSEGRFTSPPFGRGGVWDLTLTGRVPMSLEVDTGVGEANLDLRDLQLTRLELSTGVGAATIDLPRGDYDADIDTGVGAATIRIPEGVEARVSVSRGIGAIAVPEGFAREGDEYVTDGYEDASERIDLSIDSGVGAVEILRYR